MRVISMLLSFIPFIAACGDTVAPENIVYTLYSNAPSDNVTRLHMATFDHYKHKDFAEMDEAFNEEQCNLAATLFQKDWEQDTKKHSTSGSMKVKHWCEKGRFRK